MALIVEKPVASFDLLQIKRGDLIWARHHTWSSGCTGFVTSATDELLIVQYHPGIGNVTNHFRIPVSEAVDGQWEIRWSEDLSEVQEYGIPEAPGDGKEETEGGEGNNDTGGINL